MAPSEKSQLKVPNELLSELVRRENIAPSSLGDEELLKDLLEYYRTRVHRDPSLKALVDKLERVLDPSQSELSPMDQLMGQLHPNPELLEDCIIWSIKYPDSSKQINVLSESIFKKLERYGKPGDNPNSVDAHYLAQLTGKELKDAGFSVIELLVIKRVLKDIGKKLNRYSKQ